MQPNILIAKTLVKSAVAWAALAFALAPAEALANGSGNRNVAAFTLTILHNNDGESSLLPREIDGVEYGGIARFVSVVGSEKVHANSNWDRGESRRRGVLVLNSGDNFLAGLTREASNAAGTDYDAMKPVK